MTSLAESGVLQQLPGQVAKTVPQIIAHHTDPCCLQGQMIVEPLMPLDPSYQCPLLGEQQGYRAKAQGKSLQTYAPIAHALLTLDEKELARKMRKFEIC